MQKRSSVEGNIPACLVCLPAWQHGEDGLYRPGNAARGLIAAGGLPEPTTTGGDTARVSREEWHACAQCGWNPW